MFLYSVKYPLAYQVGATALHLCVGWTKDDVCSRATIATLLLDHGADVNARDKVHKGDEGKRKIKGEREREREREKRMKEKERWREEKGELEGERQGESGK